MASFVLLNDGSSFVLLNDGSSKLLLNDAPVAPDGVVLEGTHAQPQIGDGRKKHSSWTEVPEEKTCLIDVTSKIRITRLVAITSRISRLCPIAAESKILRESIHIIKSRISKMNTHEVISRISGTKLIGVLADNIQQHTDKLLKKIESNKKLDDIKELFRQYKGVNDEF